MDSTKFVQEVTGTLVINILEARRLPGTANAERTNSGYFFQIVIADVREMTERKEAHELKFDEQFEFLSASPSVPIVVNAFCKDQSGNDVNVGSAAITNDKWNAETRWVCLEHRGKVAGEVLLTVSFVRGAVPLRQPFMAVAKIAEQTGDMIAPADPYIEQGIQLASSAIKWVMNNSVTSNAIYLCNKLEKRHVLGLILANGSALLGVAVTILICVTIPALLFFPITIFFSVASAMMFAVAAMVFVPIGVLVSWMLVCSHPVQRKFVRPMLHKCLDYPSVARALIKSN